MTTNELCDEEEAAHTDRDFSDVFIAILSGRLQRLTAQVVNELHVPQPPEQIQGHVNPNSRYSPAQEQQDHLALEEHGQRVAHEVYLVELRQLQLCTRNSLPS